MLIPGTGIAWAFHEVLTFHIKFTQAVGYDMHMDVAALIMPVHVGTDKSLMSGEVLLFIFHSDLLCLFPGQSIFCYILWIETDDIMVGFDFIIGFVFVV